MNIYGRQHTQTIVWTLLWLDDLLIISTSQCVGSAMMFLSGWPAWCLWFTLCFFRFPWCLHDGGRQAKMQGPLTCTFVVQLCDVHMLSVVMHLWRHPFDQRSMFMTGRAQPPEAARGVSAFLFGTHRLCYSETPVTGVLIMYSSACWNHTSDVWSRVMKPATLHMYHNTRGVLSMPHIWKHSSLCAEPL